MRIHPITICREKLQNNEFIVETGADKVNMYFKLIEAEKSLEAYASEIYSAISTNILTRSSKRRKVLDCLKKLQLEYDYSSYVTEHEEVNVMLKEFRCLCEAYIRNKHLFEQAVESDYMLSRNMLRHTLKDNQDIYNSLSTVNPDIYEKMNWYLSGDLNNNAETRKLELVLSRVVSHAFTKTSPIGWLNEVYIIGTDGNIEYELKNNDISLNFVLLFTLYDKLILRDNSIRNTEFVLNKNYYIEEDVINIFGQIDNEKNHKLFKSRDCNVKVKLNKYFAAIINQTDKEAWSFSDVKELLQFDDEKTGMIIRKLVEMGLFRINSYFSDEGDVLHNFIKKLHEISAADDEVINDVITIFEEIQVLMEEINMNYSFELETKIIDLERKACRKCGLEIDFKTREFLYKDHIVKKNREHILSSETKHSFSKLMRLFPVFDINTRIQQEVRLEMEKKFGNLHISINEPYIFQLVTNTNLKYSGFWVEPWKCIESRSEVNQKLDELRQCFIDRIMSGALQDEVLLDEQFVDSLIEKIPDEVIDKKAAYSVFYELGDGDVIINKIYPGYMSFYNRFLRYTDIIENYKDSLNNFYHIDNVKMAEIHETFGFNANSYHPIFKSRLEFDMTRNHDIDNKYDDVINIYDTELVYKDGEFLLHNNDTDYKPVICTSLMRVLYPGVITFYSSLFSNISHASDASAVFFDNIQKDRINVSPRIKFMNIVLERRHWLFSTELLHVKKYNDNISLFSQVLNFLNENNIPTRFYYQSRKKQFEELHVASVSVEFEKPQYFDIENIVLLKGFVNVINTCKWVVVSEVLPDNIKAEEYLTEFVV
ncbi:MAG: hypothetical protein ACI4EF_12545 [Coprococcus sp.]